MGRVSRVNNDVIMDFSNFERAVVKHGIFSSKVYVWFKDTSYFFYYPIRFLGFSHKARAQEFINIIYQQVKDY